MKRNIVLTAMLIYLCILLCGCDLWMDGSYYSEKPHLEDNAPQQQGTMKAFSYSSLCDALAMLAEDGSQNGIINMPGFTQERLEEFMDRAIRQTMQYNAVAAYAVDEITYEIGTNAGKPAIAVEITYHHSRSEILRIKQTENMSDAITVITDALDDYDAGVVLKVDQYSAVDFTQVVQDYVDANPQSCVELPQVAVAVYPETGMERVVELTFTYQTSRDVLRDMQQAVERVFASARLYVSSDAQNWEKYSQLYSFLMERFDDYVEQTSITPSYSLLRHGVGDSKAFATVYAAMCQQAGLDCQVVSGTKDGVAWYWNILLEEGVYYHVDLLQCSRTGGFLAKTDEQMSGYVWDYSAYTVQTKIKE